MSFQDFGFSSWKARQTVATTTNYNSHSAQGFSAKANQHVMSSPHRQQFEADEPARIIPKNYRGVRPRLETKCPVTSRTLLRDEDQNNMSLEEASSFDGDDIQSLQSSFTQQEEDDPQIPTVKRSADRASLQRRQSIYAHLTKEIVNFQKMVAELESLMEVSGVSPESQWRTRILIRSAQDADRDIWKRLYEYESSHGDNPTYSRAQMTSRKLHRDFQRVHKQLKVILALYEKRQQVEIAFLSRQGDDGVGEDEKKEDFFDRVMREREKDVTKLHQSMQKVNEIYSDLAILVDGQQEKIDTIADQNEDSKARTQSGYEQIHMSIFGMCGPLNGSSFVVSDHDDNNKKAIQPQHHHQQQQPLSEANNGGDNYRVEEEFKWTMPFETISDDIQAVQEDVFRLIEENFQKIGGSSKTGKNRGAGGDQNDYNPMTSCSRISFEFNNDTRDCDVRIPSSSHEHQCGNTEAPEIPFEYRTSSRRRHRRI